MLYVVSLMLHQHGFSQHENPYQSTLKIMCCGVCAVDLWLVIIR